MRLQYLLITLLITFSLHAGTVTVKVFTGDEVATQGKLIESRKDEFKNFPYLMWNGDEFEKAYAAFYAIKPHGALAVAYDDDTIAGFLTGTSLQQLDVSFGKYNLEPLANHLKGLVDCSKNYYFGDVVVFEQFRGNRIVDKLFSALESHSQTLGFNSISFISVIRSSDHPQKPVNYKNTDSTWTRLGYQKSNRVVNYFWFTFQKDGSLIEEVNPCDIWIKSIP
jgi:hypothetical protein